MRSSNRACWTGRNAAVTRSTTIRDGFIRLQFKRGENFRDKKPGPEPLIDQHGTFAVPPNSSFRCVIAFQYRPGIHVTFLLSAEAGKKLIHPGQFCPNDIMIIITPRISRDTACFSCSLGPAGRGSLEVVPR